MIPACFPISERPIAEYGLVVMLRLNDVKMSRYMIIKVPLIMCTVVVNSRTARVLSVFPVEIMVSVS